MFYYKYCAGSRTNDSILSDWRANGRESSLWPGSASKDSREHIQLDRLRPADCIPKWNGLPKVLCEALCRVLYGSRTGSGGAVVSYGSATKEPKSRSEALEKGAGWNN